MVVSTARGLIAPAFTALKHDMTINYDIIPEYARFFANNGMKTVLVGGTTGETQTLSVNNRKKLIDVWLHAKKTHGFHMMVQIGGAPLQDVIELAKYCNDNGVDSVLTLPELYFKPSTIPELVDYIELVAKAAPNLPVIYYHTPARTNIQLHMPTFVKAATERIPNFKGIKYTARDLSECAEVLRALKDDQEVYIVADALLAPAALLGIKSSMAVSYTLFPKLGQGIYDAMEEGNIEKARKLQEQLSMAIEAHTAEGPLVPTMKAMMETVTGIKVGPPAIPYMSISSEAQQRIAQKLKTLNLI